MDVKNWTVCVIEPNKFERQIIFDLLRQAGVEKVRIMEYADEALEMLEAYRANIIITAFEQDGGGDAVGWTRKFRRSKDVANRKASVFVTSGAFSRGMAEQCRHAGANALIGKPLSTKVLLATINKVLTQPREFIDAEGYVGPCRRAGIVTAGEPKKRRSADAASEAKHAPHTLTLEQAVMALAGAAQACMSDPKQVKTCEAALRFVQAYAVNASDMPLRRVCAALAQLLAAQRVPNEVRRYAVEICIESVTQLTSGLLEGVERDVTAERARAVVAKAVAPRVAA